MTVTPALPQTITATVDDLDGNRHDDAVLTVRHIARLTCGCTRFSCHRPGGGYVDITVGEHCTPPVRSSPPASIPA